MNTMSKRRNKLIINELVTIPKANLKQNKKKSTNRICQILNKIAIEKSVERAICGNNSNTKSTEAKSIFVNCNQVISQLIN